jgi:hypothetical protein
MIRSRAGVDVGEQAADAVAQAGGLAGQVVVEADQHTQLGQSLVAGVDAAQGVRQRAGGIGDDVGVAGVGLRGAGMQIGEPAHRQPGQVGHLAAGHPGDGDWQRPDRGGLVDHDQHPPVARQLAIQRRQPVFGVGQRRVVQPLAVRRQPHRVVFTLADVQAEEHRVVAVVHVLFLAMPWGGIPGRWYGADRRQPRYGETNPKAARSL